MRTKLLHGIILLTLMFLLSAPITGILISDGQAYILAVTGILAFTGTGLSVAQRKDQTGESITLPDIALGVCIIYGIMNIRGLINIEYIMEWVALMGIWMLMRTKESRRFIRFLVWGLFISALIQILIVILQLAEVTSSRHADFRVTGSFDNPAPLGCYLAIVLALMWPICNELASLSLRKKILAGGLILPIAWGLAVTDSRAAWLAAAMAIAVFHLQKKLTKKNRPYLSGGILLAAVMTIGALYLYRPSSADARLGIWHVCRTMIAASPITGQGTNSFPATYMSFQTSSIRNAPEEVRRAADDVTTAFNEPLEILCEQGVAGGLLWGFFLLTAGVSLWKASKKKERQAFLFLPFLAYIIFALFSYPSSIWSLHALFISMIALGIESPYPTQVPVWALFKRRARMAGAGLFAGLLLINIVIRTNANLRLNGYCNLEEDDTAMQNSPFTFRYVGHSPSLLACLGRTQLMAGDGVAAVHSLKKLQEYINTAQVQLHLGEAYECTGENEEAIKCYAAAHSMRPGLMLPIYAQFALYKSIDEEKALQLAKDLKAFRPKIENKKTQAMRSAAIRHINKKQAL